MFKELEEKKKRFVKLQGLLGDAKVIANTNEYKKCAKELARLRKVMAKYDAYNETDAEICSLENVLNDKSQEAEFLSMAREELLLLRERRSSLYDELEELTSEKDPNVDKDVILEIRQGTGGAEAGLFAQDLFRMYARYATEKKWKTEILSISPTEKGGIKEVIFSVSGEGVYGAFKYESGTHRVQRVPATEASGRIHTSAATVAVLPEAEEVEVDIKPQDLKIDVFRAGGRGGQHVNVTDSAVRITHMPTGFVVSCQDERSQHKNKSKAMRVLRARLFDFLQAEHHKKLSDKRKVQVGSGDRSEKIRTYNFPDRRITDHRIGFTSHNLEDVLKGRLDEIVAALKTAEKKKQKAA